jgi:hypothetical protein
MRVPLHCSGFKTVISTASQPLTELIRIDTN